MKLDAVAELPHLPHDVPDGRKREEIEGVGGFREGVDFPLKGVLSRALYPLLAKQTVPDQLLNALCTSPPPPSISGWAELFVFMLTWRSSGRRKSSSRVTIIVIITLAMASRKKYEIAVHRFRSCKGHITTEARTPFVGMGQSVCEIACR